MLRREKTLKKGKSPLPRQGLFLVVSFEMLVFHFLGLHLCEAVFQLLANFLHIRMFDHREMVAGDETDLRCLPRSIDPIRWSERILLPPGVQSL